MVWVFGIIGLVIGFVAGVGMMRVWLKDKTREELLTDKSLHLSYGLFVWLVAAIFSYISVWIYRTYF